MIDAESLAGSLKDVMVEAALIQAEARMGDKARNSEALRQQMRNMINSPAVAAQLGSQLDAANLTQMMFAGDEKAQSMGIVNPGWRNEKWVNPVTFSVQDPNSEARAVFKFRGLSWKLAALEIPTSELRRFAAVMDRMP